MFKCQHSLLPILFLHYCRVNLHHPYYMRQTHYFVTPAFRTVIRAFRTVIREQSISIQGPKIWDSLPVSRAHVTETNPVTLKRNVSDYFIASY